MFLDSFALLIIIEKNLNFVNQNFILVNMSKTSPSIYSVLCTRFLTIYININIWFKFLIYFKWNDIYLQSIPNNNNFSRLVLHRMSVHHELNTNSH